MLKLFSLIHSDIKKYQRYGANILIIFFLTQGFWAIFQYRVAHFILNSNRAAKLFFLIPFLFWQKIIEVITGISIPYSVTIGHSFYIGHFGNIFLNAKTVIGNDCNLSQGVTIGVSGRGDNRGVPKIGNRVYIGANAVIVGKIEIQDNCVIGANSFVNQPMNANEVGIGNPLKIVSTKGSQEYLL